VIRVVAKPAEGGDVELEAGGGSDVQPEPGHRYGAEDVAVGKSEHAPVDGLAEAQELCCARVDLCRGLPARTAVAIELPAGAFLPNLFGREAFVVAVIEFAQEWRHAWVREPRELGCACRALQRAGEDRVKREAAEPWAKRPRLVCAFGRQRKIGPACVAADAAPLGLAVAGEVEVERQAGLPIISGRPERRERLALSITAPARTR
jgi:hypothetical protein